MLADTSFALTTRDQRDHPERRRPTRRPIRSRRARSSCRATSSPATRRSRPGSPTRSLGTEIPTYVAAERRGQGHGQGDLRRSGHDAGGHRQDAQVPARRCTTPARPFTMTVAVDDRARLARLDMPDGQPERRPQRSRRRRGANAHGAEPDRLRRHHSRQRLQHRRHADQAARPAGSGIRPSCSSPVGPGRSRRHGRRHPDPQPARRRARGAGLSRAPLRQARRRTERRPQRNRHAGGLRRRSHRHRQVAGEARRCRFAADCGGRPQRGRHDRDARGGAREEDRRARADGRDRHDRRRSDARAAAARARSDEAARGREGAESRAAEADSGRRRQRKGWEALPEDVRKQADTPWFRSLLHLRSRCGHAASSSSRSSSSRAISTPRCRRITPTSSRELARARKKAGPVEVVHLPGVNHLLVPATTGEVEEYARAEAEDDQPGGRIAIVDCLAEEVAAVSGID